MSKYLHCIARICTSLETCTHPKFGLSCQLRSMNAAVVSHEAAQGAFLKKHDEEGGICVCARSSLPCNTPLTFLHMNVQDRTWSVPIYQHRLRSATICVRCPISLPSQCSLSDVWCLQLDARRLIFDSCCLMLVA